MQLPQGQIDRMEQKNRQNTALDESLRRLGGILASPSLVMSYEHTTPLLERGRLRRMGLSASQAKIMLDGLCEHGLLDRGAQAVILQVCRERDIEPAQALQMLLRGEGWPEEEQ